MAIRTRTILAALLAAVLTTAPAWAGDEKADQTVKGELPPDRVYIVRYHRLMAEFDVVMREICVFIGQPLTPELEKIIDSTAASQRARKSEHEYNLAEYGLTKERIHKDFAFVYDTFDIPRT